jgi:hypothetical protein
MYQNLLFHIYTCMKLNMFRATHRPSSGALKLQCQPLVFHNMKIIGRVAGGRCQAHCAWQRPPPTHSTTFHLWKTRGCQCIFRLLMMDGVSPETCLALCKYGIINVNTLMHLVGFYLWIVLWRTDPRRWNTLLTKVVRIGIVTHKIKLYKMCLYLY